MQDSKGDNYVLLLRNQRFQVLELKASSINILALEENRINDFKIAGRLSKFKRKFLEKSNKSYRSSKNQTDKKTQFSLVSGMAIDFSPNNGCLEFIKSENCEDMFAVDYNFECYLLSSQNQEKKSRIQTASLRNGLNLNSENSRTNEQSSSTLSSFSMTLMDNDLRRLIKNGSILKIFTFISEKLILIVTSASIILLKNSDQRVFTSTSYIFKNMIKVAIDQNSQHKNSENLVIILWEDHIIYYVKYIESKLYIKVESKLVVKEKLIFLKIISQKILYVTSDGYLKVLQVSDDKYYQEVNSYHFVVSPLTTCFELNMDFYIGSQSGEIQNVEFQGVKLKKKKNQLFSYHKETILDLKIFEKSTNCKVSL